MTIKNIEGLTGEDLRQMVSQGGKFVVYKFAISIIFMSLRNNSVVYFIKPGESRIKPGIKFALISFFLGWWGIPWGPIYTIGSFINVFKGGEDYTSEIIAEINQNDDSYGHSGYGMDLNNSNSANSDGGQTYNIQ
ncbi:MAG TPA: hypothetical protein VGF79_05455 [Bacteroidia bacterium]